jgi:uncharacterized phage protein (TIGR02216 family)
MPADAWAPLLRQAALRLGLPPAAFWRLSLKEWRALAGPAAAPPLDRAALDALIAAFPDDRP